MNTKHTPGPWTFRHYEWGNEVSDDFGVFHDDGIGAGRHVADVAKIYQGERQPEVEQANARLIAAAPELLASLHALLDIIHDDLTHSWQEDHREALEAAKNAIAKATKP